MERMIICSFLIILLLISLGNASYKNTDMEFIHQKGLPHDVFETLLEKFVSEIKELDWTSFDTGHPVIKYEDIFFQIVGIVPTQIQKKKIIFPIFVLSLNRIFINSRKLLLLDQNVQPKSKINTF